MPTSYMKSYGLEADQIQAAAGDPSVVSNPRSSSNPSIVAIVDRAGRTSATSLSMVTSYINRVDMQYTIIMAAMVKSLRSLIAAEDLL